MQTYRKRPLKVQAEQWFPGKEVPGVVVPGAEIIRSRDRKYYYIRWRQCRATRWLEIEARPGPVPDDQKKGSLDGYAQFRDPKDGRQWHRHVLPFMFYEVKSTPAEQIEETSQLFRDYGLIEEWKSNAPVYAYVVTIHGERATLAPGDWVIREPDGEHYYPCKPDIFEATYEAVEG